MKSLFYQWFKKNNVMFVNAGSLIGATGITSMLGFVYWWAAARLYLPQTVGFASAAISMMMLLGTIGILGLSTLLVGELPRHPGKEWSLISAALLLVGGVAGCLGAVFAVVAPHLSPDLRSLGASIENVVLFALGVSLTAITLVLDQALIGLLQGGLQLWRNTLFAVVKLIALVGLSLFVSHVTGLAVYMTWIVGNVLSLLVLGGCVVIKGKGSSMSFRPQWGLLRKLGPAALQHHALNLMFQAPVLVLPMLVTIMLSAATNACFYVSLGVTSLISMVPIALTTVLYAESAVQPAVLAQKMRLTLSLACGICVLAVAALWLGSAQILGLFGSSYVGATWCMRILALGAFPVIIKNHYAAISRIQGRVGSIVLPFAAIAALQLAGAALGAYFGRLSGLSLGWLLADCVGALWMCRSIYQVVMPAGDVKGEARGIAP